MHLRILAFFALILPACSTTVDLGREPDAAAAAEDAALTGDAAPDGGLPRVDAAIDGGPENSLTRTDELPLTPPFPGPYRVANVGSIAFDGRFYLVAYTHHSAAYTPCSNCGTPRLRGVLLDASFEPVERYGFPIGEAADAVRTLALEDGFAVGYWRRTSVGDHEVAIALVRGGDGRVTGRAAPSSYASEEFDFATDGRDVLVAWYRPGVGIEAGRVAGDLTGEEEIAPEVLLCEGRCSVPRVVFDGTRFIASYTDETGAHEARAIEIEEDGALSLGWRTTIVPARTVDDDHLRRWGGLAVAMAVSGDTLLASWDEPATALEPEHRLLAARFRTTDGARIDATPVVVRTAPAFETSLFVDGISARAVVPMGDTFGLLLRRAEVVAAMLAPHTGELIRLDTSTGALVAGPPVLLGSGLTRWQSTEIPGIAGAWDGERLTVVWDQHGQPLQHARIADAAVAVEGAPFGIGLQRQRWPAAAALDGVVLATFDGSEVDSEGRHRTALQAVRIDAGGVPLDAEPRALHAPEVSWGQVSSITAGGGSFLAAWFEDGSPPLGVPHAVRAARLGPDGSIRSELLLDDTSDASDDDPQIARTEVRTAFAADRFLVAWGRTGAPDTSTSGRSTMVASIGAASGELASPWSIPEMHPGGIAAVGDRIVVAGTRGEIATGGAGGFEVGGSLCPADVPCMVEGLVSHESAVVALTRVQRGVGSDAVWDLEMVEIDAEAGAPSARVSLPSMTCHDTRECDYAFVHDGVAFRAVLRDEETGVTLASARRTDDGFELGERVLVSSPEEDWASIAAAPVGPGRIVMVYGRLDSELDAARIMTRSVLFDVPS